ncbi:MULTISPECIES: hypothetical protein [unclassified Yoonia]|uniref:hypothetical protein n=1 Tax=unclassified Yoonia TaxID=2629118 RepID=UPI002AFE7121|nr:MULTISPECIES: hypothetical protein [unclassified Yoonia]
MLRYILVYGLVLVMLPWGAWANALASIADVQESDNRDIASFAAGASPVLIDASAETDKITIKSKRCRIAVLAGISCVSDLVWQRVAIMDGDGLIEKVAYFGEVMLPQGIAATGYTEPPRLS